MSKMYCKEDCEFLHSSSSEEAKCTIYNRSLDIDEKGIKRLESCINDSKQYKIQAQIDDIEDYYNVFVSEMDFMFERLSKLMKGEK